MQFPEEVGGQLRILHVMKDELMLRIVQNRVKEEEAKSEIENLHQKHLALENLIEDLERKSHEDESKRMSEMLKR